MSHFGADPWSHFESLLSHVHYLGVSGLLGGHQLHNSKSDACFCSIDGPAVNSCVSHSPHSQSKHDNLKSRNELCAGDVENLCGARGVHAEFWAEYPWRLGAALLVDSSCSTINCSPGEYTSENEACAELRFAICGKNNEQACRSALTLMDGHSPWKLVRQYADSLQTQLQQVEATRVKARPPCLANAWRN